MWRAACASTKSLASCVVLFFQPRPLRALSLATRAAQNGFTPLHNAAGRGHAECVRLLLRTGAPADVRNKSEETPLHLSCYCGDVDTVEALVEFGADVELRNQFGETPLFYAARKRHPQIVRLLLECGADAKARNRFDDTAADEAGPDFARTAEFLETGPRRGAAVVARRTLQRIMSFLSHADLCSCMLVSRRWHSVAEGRELWEARGVKRAELSMSAVLGFAPAVSASASASAMGGGVAKRKPPLSLPASSSSTSAGAQFISLSRRPGSGGSRGGAE